MATSELFILLQGAAAPSKKFIDQYFGGEFAISYPLFTNKFTFITSRLYLRTFCDISLDTERAEVTES